MQLADLSIIGRTGLRQYGGRVHEELLTQLSGTRAVRIYREMADNDAVIGAILFAVEMLIRQVEWQVLPATENIEDIEAAEFLESCIGDMSHSWEDFIAEVLSMLIYGWSYFEIVYKLRKGDTDDPTKRSKFDDGRTGWRKFAIRAQETLDRWEFDEEGGIRGMWQTTPSSTEHVFIPIEKALLFRTTLRRNSPEGRSILRNAYRSWYFLKNIQEIEAIGIERELAGLPKLQVPPELLNPNATPAQKALLQDLQTMIFEVRRNERQGIIVPAEETPDGRKTGYKFELVSTGGQRQIDTSAVITRYEQRIAMTVLADFIMLGLEKVGSFALASSKTHLFGVALSAWLDSIAAVLNNFAVPRLFKLNGMNLEALPKIVHSDIEAPPLDELAKFIQALAGAGMPLFPDENLERRLREMAKLPPPPEEL